ncbi:MAG: hypothetical protein BGO51_20580 [Rhodospirillales bacterium 69-11]|jgi:sulfite exporter TauE/SafE|nr:sulfite exporter TauE/SafE family protein [Rhodospirillales bacterium]OJW27772.1 MAG: hypothetical protein BGO51_20580 [Rhodospirillales bacterium 69-11]
MAWCGAVPTGGGILATLAVAGLAGAPMHCGPMCGGFVLGQVADRMAVLPVARFCEWRRVRAGLLLPYHLGRLTTYVLLGALAGAGGGALMQLPWFGRLSALLLLCGAALFLLHALRRLAPRIGAAIPSLDRAPSGWSRLLARAAGRIDRGRPRGGYALGVLLGFLPCGMLYAALIAVAGAGSAALGATAMLAFGLGTAPTLMLIGLAGQAAGGRWQATVARVSPALLLLNAALLAALALRGLAGIA